MKIHRFYDPACTMSQVYEITAPHIVHQIHRVIRLHLDEEIEVFDGKGRVGRYIITNTTSVSITVQLQKIPPVLTPPRAMSIAFALIKKDKCEWLVQKCVELGVTSFQPFTSSRTEKKDISFERLEHIAIEAVEQSGWSLIPEIHPVCTFETLCARNTSGMCILTVGAVENFSHYIHTPLERVCVCIGPEGGFTDAEIDSATKAGMHLCVLGESVLRAETAAVAASSLLLLS